MAVTELNFPTVMNSVRGARKIAYPNYGFQKQLERFEFGKLTSVHIFSVNHIHFDLISKISFKTRYRIQRIFGPTKPEDTEICKKNEEIFWKQFDRPTYSKSVCFK